VLLAIAVLGIGLSVASEVWVTTARRQKAAQLEWVGRQYVDAIGSYYGATPGLTKVYPSRLEDLVEDRRYVIVRRHLRTLYPNPLTSKPDWDLVKGSDGGIRGVRVAAPTGTPISVHEFVYVPVAPR
jgi:type II secretory pathway pseudopilin PulG